LDSAYIFRFIVRPYELSTCGQNFLKSIPVDNNL